MDLKGHASEIATDLHSKGFGAIPIMTIITFITTMIQNLLQCMQPDPLNAEAHTRAYVTKRWTAENGYERPLMRRAKAQARRAAKKHNMGKLTDEQQEEAALAALDKARTGTGLGAGITQALAAAANEDE